MGQFKPMVKMMTTEPSVELKLKKGGHVAMKKAGKAESGHKKMAMGGLPGGPVGGAIDALPMMSRGAAEPAAPAPARPSMAARRAAMVARARKAQRMPMKEGGETSAEHKAEMSKMKGLEKELKSHESKPASKGHKGLKTGGVAMGQGGYKDGGIINTEGQGGKYRNTMMHTAKPDRSPAKTGGVKEGNAGGYKAGGAVNYVDGNVTTTPAGVSGTKTGGVKKGNAGGYKAGGATKKAYATGGAVNKTGSAVAMPQGAKKPSAPVSIDRLSGTFKKGGRVKKMADGGDVEDLSKGAYDRALSDTPTGYSFAKKVHNLIDRGVGMFKGMGKQSDKDRQTAEAIAPSKSVTKTKESVTVTPAKKRGGAVKC